MGIKTISVLWGMAEATFFFIVPDVWLSYAGREKLSKGIRACLFALIGALLGGMMMYAWGSSHPDAALKTLNRIPGISEIMINQADEELTRQGITAILLAPLKGAPYKIYAVQAGKLSVPLWQVVLISIPARLVRFLTTTTLCHFALKLGLGKKSARLRQIALTTGWIIFYSVYFIRMGW